MRLSLVVCTRNRASQLEKTLQSLQRLRCQLAWELIVVDNGSSDDTARIITAYQTSLGIKMVVEPRAGVGRARNRGWRASSGDIVAFTDDDCYPAEDCLAAIVRSFTTNASLGFVGGRVKLHDPRDFPITIKDRDEPELFGPREFISAGAVHGANFSFRRAALEQVGGFDERLGAGTRFACEDIDILARILAVGWHGAYDPRVVVAHHHGRRAGNDVIRLARQYDRGRGAYYIKCILNPRIRYVAAKNWYWAMLRQPFAVTVRELSAGAQFLLCAGADALRRIGRKRSPDRGLVN